MQNAIEFSPPAGRLVIRETPAAETPAAVDVVVEDDGPGLPEFARTRVFEKFKGVAVLHGGEIRLESPPEGGLRAGLRLLLSDEAGFTRLGRWSSSEQPIAEDAEPAKEHEPGAPAQIAAATCRDRGGRCSSFKHRPLERPGGPP